MPLGQEASVASHAGNQSSSREPLAGVGQGCFAGFKVPSKAGFDAADTNHPEMLAGPEDSLSAELAECVLRDSEELAAVHGGSRKGHLGEKARVVWRCCVVSDLNSSNL
jgi:hypothetical protein